jgi:hypothetical protein
MIFTPRDSALAMPQRGSVVKSRLLTLTPSDSEKVIEIGSTKVTVSFDGTACYLKTDKFSVPIRANKNVGAGTPAESVSIPLANSKSSYTLMFPGYSLLTAPKKEAELSYRCGFVMRGQSSGLSFFLYDDNLEGQFGLERGAIGVSEGDSAVVVFAPASAHFATGKSVVDFSDIAADGSTLSYEKRQGPVGNFQLSYASDSLEFYGAFKSKDADTSFVADASSRLAAKIAAPPGNYQLQYAIAYCPALKRIAATVAGSDLPASELQAGKETKVALGAPYRLDFVATYEHNNVKIDPRSFHLRGKNGEEYRGFTFTASAAPQVVLLLAGKQISLEPMHFT